MRSRRTARHDAREDLSRIAVASLVSFAIIVMISVAACREREGAANGGRSVTL